MPNKWYNNLSSQNIGYTPIKKIQGWFVRDDTIPYQVLPSHQYFDFDLEKGGMYQLATVKGINPDSTDGKCWIPFLPGYRIFTHYKDTYFQLSIGLDDETQCLEFICR
nr:8930_t:CDS:2 [Entrophospora candida]